VREGTGAFRFGANTYPARLSCERFDRTGTLSLQPGVWIQLPGPGSTRTYRLSESTCAPLWHLGFKPFTVSLRMALRFPIGINRRASSNNESLVYCQDDSRERMLCLQQSNQYRLENDRGTALGLATGNLHCAFRSMQENKPHLARRSGRCSLRSSHFS
jgi:hypothetical protein